MLDHPESPRSRQLVSDGMLIALTFGSLIATAGSVFALVGPVEWEDDQLPYVRNSALLSLITLFASGAMLIRRASR